MFLRVNDFFIYIVLKVTGSASTRKTYFEIFHEKFVLLSGLLQERKFYQKETCEQVFLYEFFKNIYSGEACEWLPLQVKLPGNLEALETYGNSLHTLVSIYYVYRAEVFGWRLKRLQIFSLLSGLRTNRNSVIMKLVICNCSCQLLSMCL